LNKHSVNVKAKVGIRHRGLTGAQRAHLEELLRNRPQWFKGKILTDIAAEERRNDEDGIPRTGFSAYTLACLESELGIM